MKKDLELKRVLARRKRERKRYLRQSSRPVQWIGGRLVFTDTGVPVGAPDLPKPGKSVKGFGEVYPSRKPKPADYGQPGPDNRRRPVKLMARSRRWY